WIKGSASMEAIVSELGAAHSESKSYNPAMWAQQIKNSLSDQGSFQEGSFEELITRCTSLSQWDVAVNFLRMLGLIQLVTKCQSKFAALAAGGTIYILVMVAGLELRTTVGSMVGDSSWQLGNALRQPDPSKHYSQNYCTIAQHTCHRYRHWKMPTLQEREVDLVWTEEQWGYAEHAVKMYDVDQLVQYLEGLYADGTKSPSNVYIHIPNSLIRGHQLELHNDDGTLMAYICGTMPSSIRDSLLQQLLLAFEDENLLVDRDTSQDSNNSFEFTPYVSVETALNQDLYELVKVIFGDLFQWIQKNICRILHEFLPKEYDLLEASTHIIPGNHHSPVLPFLLLVFNLNVTTKGHRDGKDKHFCLVLPIGVFVGGELVMMETGLVVEVLQGDFIIFPSANITHFNLHYQGRRASAKSKANSKGAQEHLNTVQQGNLYISHYICNANSTAYLSVASRKCTQDMLAAEDEEQQEDNDDLDDLDDLDDSRIALSQKRARQLPDTLDDEEEELGRLMQDDMEKQAKTGKKARHNGHGKCSCAQLRGELVSKAHHKTSSSYNIPGNMSPSALSETIQWILKNDAFLYDKLDLANKTFDRKTPFCNQLFKDLFITQWFGARGEAWRFTDEFRKVPDSILALIATVVCCLSISIHILTFLCLD
ncbi:hypothetical protein EDB19DRAFT_1652203, partial [Suillus lakei]